MSKLSVGEKIWKRNQNSSKGRGLDFDIPLSKYIELIFQSCFYCGAKSSNEYSSDNKVYRFNGLDRIDNSKGYTMDNVVTSCRFCNTLRGSIPIDDWCDFLDGVTNNWANELNTQPVNDRAKKRFSTKW